MLEILQFIFSGFWIWLGTVSLIAAIGIFVARIIYSVRGVGCECEED